MEGEFNLSHSVGGGELGQEKAAGVRAEPQEEMPQEHLDVSLELQGEDRGACEPTGSRLSTGPRTLGRRGPS